VRQVGDAQQEFAQGTGDIVGLGGELALSIAQRTALRLERLGTRGVAVAPLLPHLLGKVVDLGAQCIAGTLQLPGATLEGDGLGELAEQLGLVAARQRGAHTLGVGTQETDVDHGNKANGGRTSKSQGYAVASSAVAAVEVEGLTVRYGELVAVHEASFAAASGMVTAVLGPNGAGKTSTIEVCEGYRHAAGGTVRVLGLDPATHQRQLGERIGVMLQEGGVYPSGRVLDTVRHYCALYDKGVDAAAAAVADGQAKSALSRVASSAERVTSTAASAASRCAGRRGPMMAAVMSG